MSDLGLWEVAFDNGKPEWPTDDKMTFAEGAEWGAGWAFALIGMAQAIRETYCCPCGEHIGIGLMHFEHAPP